MRKKHCQVCDPFLVSRVKEHRALFWDKETPLNICDCLVGVRVLSLSRNLRMEVTQVPQEMEKLIHLRYLNLYSIKLSKKDLDSVCKLYFLQTLLLGGCGIKEIPREIGNLVKLKYMDLSMNGDLRELPENICSLVELQTLLLILCSLEELPKAIGNLVRLKELDLTANRKLRKLPESICSLVELQTLNIHGCCLIPALPEGIHRLKNLKHLLITQTEVSLCLPIALAQLSGLCTLNIFHGGSGCSRMGLLKNLNRLTGYLILTIDISNRHAKELVEDAGEAELRNKKHLGFLSLHFNTLHTEEWISSLSVAIMDALEPSHELKHLEISEYKGWRLPRWISSPLDMVTEIDIRFCRELLSLPAMGKLPFLEKLHMMFLHELKLVGREWLGITSSTTPSSSTNNINGSVASFPKLMSLSFVECPKWEEWEDITAEEEESAAVQIMPCLTHLVLSSCEGLKTLPHRLLSKLHSLQRLSISNSSMLQICYGDEDGSPRRSLFQTHPQLQLFTGSRM